MDILQDSIKRELHMTPHNTIKIVSKLKTVHGLMVTNRNEAMNGKRVSQDDLRLIKNMSLNLVELAEEIRTKQAEVLNND